MVAEADVVKLHRTALATKQQAEQHLIALNATEARLKQQIGEQAQNKRRLEVRPDLESAVRQLLTPL
jgi:hypothetical protein